MAAVLAGCVLILPLPHPVPRTPTPEGVGRQPDAGARGSAVPCSDHHTPAGVRALRLDLGDAGRVLLAARMAADATSLVADVPREAGDASALTPVLVARRWAIRGRLRQDLLSSSGVSVCSSSVEGAGRRRFAGSLSPPGWLPHSVPVGRHPLWCGSTEACAWFFKSGCPPRPSCRPATATRSASVGCSSTQGLLPG